MEPAADASPPPPPPPMESLPVETPLVETQDTPDAAAQPLTLDELTDEKETETEKEAEKVEKEAETEKEAEKVEKETPTETPPVTETNTETEAETPVETEMPAESVVIEMQAPVEDDDDDDDDDDFQDPITGDYLDEDEAEGAAPALLVPPTLSFSVNEMDVVTNRGGRSGSLSRFLDDADSFRRRSLPSYPDEMGIPAHGRKKMTLEAFLDMAIDPVLEILEDTDSDIRLWLTQPETVKEVLAEFVTPPVLSGEPHEEYGYYKKHFLCSEIIMKLYTGEEDLYESFSSDSSSGSTATTAVFGCQEDADIEKWALLYSVFDNPKPLDEMQLLFFSKALVRLHDGFCLEEGYVANVLKPFLPRVVPHLYSNTIKYMLTLILQSYESVHPITGRNDAMEIAAPLLAHATRVADKDEEMTPENLALVENTSNLLVDMLQANQADRLGAFCRREGGVYLSKYFVRDQFGTIRGFESMTHGYHNFLQYMLLEELAKRPEIVDELFANAVHELETTRSRSQKEAASALNVHIATELLVLCAKLYTEESDGSASDEDDDNQRENDKRRSSSSAFSSSYSSFDQYPSSPRESSTETSMYNLAALARGRALWSYVRKVAQRSAPEFVAQLDKGLPSSVEISLAKYLNALVALHDHQVDAQLHTAALIPTYFNILKKRSTFDMLLIHVVPAISFVVRDADSTRAADCPLTADLFADKESILDVLLLAKTEIPSLDIYAAILHDVMDEVLSVQTSSANNMRVLEHCKDSASWQQLLKITGVTQSETSSSSERGSDERSSSLKERVSSAVATEEETEQEEEPVEEDQEKSDAVLAKDDHQKLQDNKEVTKAVEEIVVVAAEVVTAEVATIETTETLEVITESAAEMPAMVKEEDEEDEDDKPRSSSVGVDNQLEAAAEEETAKEETGRPSTTRTSRFSRVSSFRSDKDKRGSVHEKSAAKSESDENDSDTIRKSTHYLKQVLQSPVFKTPMRLGGVIKTPSPQTQAASASAGDQSASGSSSAHTTRNSFGWNTMFKRLRKTLVTSHTEKPENKKLLALSNEPFAGAAGASSSAGPPVAPRLTDVLIVDTSKGEDLTTFVHRDGGVVVTDVPLPTTKHTNVASTSGMNVVTAGYMYKSKLPETGQRHLWERYYFVLNRSDGSLSYYISETHAKDRTFVRGTSRPLSVSEGIPVHVASGQRSVYGFQINTQGHGCFMVLVDSIDTRLTWLTEIVACVSANTQQQQQRLSLLGSGSEHSEPVSGGRHSLTGAPPKLTKQELKELVVEFYRNLFGPSLKFSSPMDAPASFWMEEKIDPVSEACVLRSNLPDCVPYWGEFHGYKRLCDYWKTRDETVERSSGRVLRVVVDEDEGTAVVLTSTTYRILRNSEIVTEESCDIVNVTNGAISSIHCTFDSHRVAQAFKKEGVSAS